MSNSNIDEILEPLLTNSMTGGSKDYDTHELFDEAKQVIQQELLKARIEVYEELIPTNRHVYGEDARRVIEANDKLVRLKRELKKELEESDK